MTRACAANSTVINKLHCIGFVKKTLGSNVSIFTSHMEDV